MVSRSGKTIAASALLFCLICADRVLAQPEIGIQASCLVSIQPIDDAYVGSPYLSEGLGGIGVGAGAAFNLIALNHLVVGVEYTSVWFEKEHYGRLVLGGYPLDGIPATTRFRDSLVSFLAGFATSGETRLIFLAGVGARLDRTTIDGVEQENYDDHGELPPLIGGVDWMRPLSRRAKLVIGGRYTYNERHTRLQYLGIGPHSIRAGAGVRIRLN